MSRRRVAVAVPVAILACALWLAAAAPAAPQPGSERQDGKQQRGGKPDAGGSKRGEKQGKGGKKKRRTPGPEVEARAWGLIDGRTGEVLVSHAGNRRLPIASATKLMTAYVAIKELPLDKVVRAADYESELGESLLYLRPGQKVSVRDLIYGLILRSGNDAAYTLALRVSGSVPKFVALMNRYAAALGLSNTHFANPIGLDEKGNYSSAIDLMTLSRRLLQIPAFAKIAAAREAELTSLKPPRRITTINELLYDAPWATGVKTGHTWGAGWVLVGSGRKKGTELISVALGAPTAESRFAANLDLLEWGFGQYRRRRAVARGQALAEAPIRYSGGTLPLRAARSVRLGLRKDQRLEIDVEAPREVTGPIRRGTPLGRVTVLVDGSPAAKVALRAGRSIPRATTLDRVRYFLDHNPVPVLAGVCAILLVGILLYLWVRSRRRRRRN